MLTSTHRAFIYQLGTVIQPVLTWVAMYFLTDWTNRFFEAGDQNSTNPIDIFFSKVSSYVRLKSHFSELVGLILGN